MSEVKQSLSAAVADHVARADDAIHSGVGLDRWLAAELPGDANEMKAAFNDVLRNYAELDDLPEGQSRESWLAAKIEAEESAVGLSGFEPEGTPDGTGRLSAAAHAIRLNGQSGAVLLTEVDEGIITEVVAGEPAVSPPARQRVRDWFEADLTADSGPVVLPAAVASLKAARRINPAVSAGLAVAATFVGCHAAKAAFHGFTGKSPISRILSHVGNAWTAALGLAVSWAAPKIAGRVGGFIGASVGALIGLAPLGATVGMALGKVAAGVATAVINGEKVGVWTAIKCYWGDMLVLVDPGPTLGPPVVPYFVKKALEVGRRLVSALF